MLLYFDNCCLNRPYDDQTQLKIFLETLAKLSIQSAILEGMHTLAWSYMLDYEIGKSPFRERAERFMQWKKHAVCFCHEEESILQNAEVFRQRGLKITDAMHAACAIFMNCDCLLTTDTGMFGKDIPGITILNPLEFVERGL
jgi:predicted nucleic acid-binding protein